jgi:ATP-dependent Zn protease
VSLHARTLTDGHNTLAQALINRAWQQVRELLAANMDAVAALATQLKRAGRLSSEEVHELLEVTPAAPAPDSALTPTPSGCAPR